MNWTVHLGDVRETLRSLPAQSVQCCVTSPPYWGLRDYGVDGQIGQEPTPDAYVETMVDVFREVRRVLHDSGTVWLNVGDSYARNGGTGGCGPNASVGNTTSGEQQRNCKTPDGLKEKDLCMIPWRLAIALQADGWWLRSVICWAKKSCMPESVTDRPTNSWEPIFLLAKSAQYFYDAEAVKETAQDWSVGGPGIGINETHHYAPTNGGNAGLKGIAAKYKSGDMPNTRNQRNVWHLGPEPYADAHFATFPTEIPRRAIKAGTSDKGCCPLCFAPWVRNVERVGGPPKGDHRKRDDFADTEYNAGAHPTGTVTGGSLSSVYAKYGYPESRRRLRSRSSVYAKYGYPESRTVGWEPGCECHVDPIPCTVIDPFTGSGTTGEVAIMEGRNFIGCELNPEYVTLARKRIHSAAPLFAQEVVR